MPIVDSRGRVFGRINLIDLFVVVFAGVLVPLAYGGYLLLRIPPPRIVSVTPASVSFTKAGNRQLQVTGEHLRPYLRAKVGTADVISYEAFDKSRAEIRLGEIPFGTYDLTLLDESQEIARLRNAVTVEPPPLQVVGTVPAAAATRLSPGMTFGPADRPIGELLRVEDPEKHRVVVRVVCQLSPQSDCMVGGVRVRATPSLELQTSSGDRFTLAIDELRADANWVEVGARLMTFPESAPVIRAGDIDGDDGTLAASGRVVATGAVVVSVGEVHKNQGTFAFNASQIRPGPMHVSTGVSGNVQVDAVDVRMIVPLRHEEGDRYHDVPVRPGSVFPFEARRYQAQALVMTVGGVE